jgi:hypothetical protein
MIDKLDSRIPNTSTTWQLWHSDIFDRESEPSMEVSGMNIIQGLYELWLYTLKEAIQDNGSASFSRFQLTWGNTPTTRVEVVVNPFNNLSLIKLRRWANLMSQHQENKDILIVQRLEEPRDAILMRVAQLHYELLQKSSRWKAPAIDWGAEARELLARVESMTDPNEL